MHLSVVGVVPRGQAGLVGRGHRDGGVLAAQHRGCRRPRRRSRPGPPSSPYTTPLLTRVMSVRPPIRTTTLSRCSSPAAHQTTPSAGFASRVTVGVVVLLRRLLVARRTSRCRRPRRRRATATRTAGQPWPASAPGGGWRAPARRGRRGSAAPGRAAPRPPASRPACGVLGRRATARASSSWTSRSTSCSWLARPQSPRQRLSASVVASAASSGGAPSSTASRTSPGQRAAT